MYLERTKNKLGSANAKIHTGGSEVVKRLHRKTGGSVTRTKHALGGAAMNPRFASMAPADVASKFKKGKRVKREKHFLGALLGTALPALASLFMNR